MVLGPAESRAFRVQPRSALCGPVPRVLEWSYCHRVAGDPKSSDVDSAHFRMGFIDQGQGLLDAPTGEGEVVQAFVLLRCRNDDGQETYVFQTDREFPWTRLAPFWMYVGRRLESGPYRDYLPGGSRDFDAQW